MLQSTKDFLNGINGQLHDNRVSVKTGQGIADHMQEKERWDQMSRSEKSRSDFELSQIRKGNKGIRINADDCKSLLQPIREVINENRAFENELYNKIANIRDSEEGRTELERLIEIEEEKLDQNESRMAQAIDKNDKDLIRQIASEKTVIDKTIAFYQEKLQEMTE